MRHKLNQLTNVAARGSAAAPFVPTDLGAALIAWWNADDHGTANMTDDGAGLISQWKDRVGGLALTATLTARPLWTAIAFNTSFAGVTFDGVANTLRGTTLTGLPVGATPGYILAASNPGVTSNVNSKFIFQYGNSTNGQNRQIIRRTTANGDVLRASDGGATLSSSAGAWLTPGQVSGSFDSTVTSYLNGTAGTTSSSGTLNTNTTRIAMGSDVATTAGNFSLIVNRQIFVTTALTTQQRQQMEGWIATDCGL